MKTTQAVIARLEGGGNMPSTRTLERYAKATGTRLKISFEQKRRGRNFQTKLPVAIRLPIG